jgi:hypothetical protein
MGNYSASGYCTIFTLRNGTQKLLGRAVSLALQNQKFVPKYSPGCGRQRGAESEVTQLNEPGKIRLLGYAVLLRYKKHVTP